MKNEFKSLYTTIRYHNFLYFLCEIEFKYKFRTLSDEKKIEKFFEFFNLIKDSGCDIDFLKSEDFLNNEDLNIYFYEDDD